MLEDLGTEGEVVSEGSLERRCSIGRNQIAIEPWPSTRTAGCEAPYL